MFQVLSVDRDLRAVQMRELQSENTIAEGGRGRRSTHVKFDGRLHQSALAIVGVHDDLAP